MLKTMLKTKKEDIVEVRERGNRLFRLKQYSEALNEFDKCAHRIDELDTKDQKDILVHIALSSFNMGDINKCWDFFKKALEIDKSTADLFKGYDYNEMDVSVLYDEAICHLIRVDDINKPINVVKKELKQIKDKEEKKRKHLEYESKNYNAERALEVSKALVKLDKNNPNFWYLFGISCHLNGHNKEAISAFDVVVEIKPEYDNEKFISDLFLDVAKERETEVPKDDIQSKQYKTKRGVFVRSKAEVMIDNFYFNHNIKARYEPTIVLDGKTLHPDWIIELNDGIELIHEHVSKLSKVLFDFKEKLFKKNNRKYIVTYDHEEEDINKVLIEKLSPYVEL